MTKWEIGLPQPKNGTDSSQMHHSNHFSDDSGLNCGCMVGTVGMLGGGLGYGRLKPDVVAQAERVWCVLTSTMLYLRSGP